MAGAPGAHVCSYLSAAAARCDGRPLFTCGGRAASATQVAARVAALAVGLTQRLGVQVRPLRAGAPLLCRAGAPRLRCSLSLCAEERSPRSSPGAT